MIYEQIHEFISAKMKMSHIYQPVMILSLLEHRGTCHQQDIAASILGYDLSQLEYYTKITNNMVGRVLSKNRLVEKQGKNYQLLDFDKLSPIEVEKLKLACQERLVHFIETRGSSAWEHRKKSSGYVSGTIRYNVLKRAKFHCELCGISAQEKALEVDHILPRNNGGTDDEENLQCLCYSCNAMKRDRDDTDFRLIRESYDHREKDCLFCDVGFEQSERIIQENNLAYVIRDGFPVTEYHTLIIPKRHLATYFDLGQAEINAVTFLLNSQKEQIQKLDPTVTGFNIGMNCGEDSGQTIFHCHIHLIPRRRGDVENPRGGVRHIIADKGFY
jgi:diadenosine tetraphosphate (Ap4A) HIT family hydrolase